MRILIVLLHIFVLSINAQENSKLWINFGWEDIKPESIVQSRGTTTFNSPVFVYSIREKQKLENRMQLMLEEISYLRKQVRTFEAQQKTWTNSLHEVESKHLAELTKRENVIALYEKLLENISKVVERQGISSRKSLIDHVRDAAIIYKLVD